MLMPVTPVAARTRSRRSVDAPPTRSRIPTRTTRRNPLASSTTVAAPDRKRKAGREEVEQSKKPRPGPGPSTWLQTHAAATPHKLPNPSTPQRPPPRTPNPPTPARDILSGDVVKATPRPPTPPRTAERTPRNGYPPRKRPHTPEGDGRAVAQRFGFSSVARPRPVQQKLFFTPQPQRRDTYRELPTRPLFTPQARSEGVRRPIAGLPARAVPLVAEDQPQVATVKEMRAAPPSAPELRVSMPEEDMGVESNLGEYLQAAKTSLDTQPLGTVDEEAPQGMDVDGCTSVNAEGEDKPTSLRGVSDEVVLPPSPTPRTVPLIDPSPTVDSVVTDANEAQESIAPLRMSGRRPPAVAASLPLRRPSTRPSAAPSFQRPTASSASKQADVTATPSTRRVPSYPSSLGSGPLSRPTPRKVSTTASVRSVSNPAPSTNKLEPGSPTARAVSDPPLRSVSGSSLGNDPSRRQSFADTSRNLSALNDALAKLRLPGPSTDTVRPKPVRKPFVSSLSSSSASTTPVGTTPRPRNLSSSNRPSLASLPIRSVNPTASSTDKENEHTSLKKDKHTAAYNRSFAALMAAQKGGSFLKGVVAYVDVRNEDGDDTGATFVDMLRNCGARVMTRPTESCTHFVYKSGKPATSAFWRKMPSDRRPHVVGLRWVTRTLEAGQRAPEEEHRVDFGDDELFQKRRRSMEPKMMGTPSSTSSRPSRPSGRSGRLPTIADGPYTPKIGSPLKKVHSLR